MYKRILVPVDGSAPSKRGLEEAVRIAGPGTTVRVIHVVNELNAAPAYLTLMNVDQVLAKQREQANAVLHDAMVIARGCPGACQSAIVETMGTEAAHAIVREAYDWEADLIVMGTHGRRGLRRLALGSDAELVLRLSPVPLLLVREKPEAR
jgi:nucleotide-binding universal stress UspA family protein